MASTRSTLCLLGPFEQFETLWTRLAGANALELLRLEGVDHLEASRSACDPLIIVAAEDKEDEALDLLHRAHRACVAAPIVVGSSTDHRLAVAIMRRGAASYFALPADEHRLEEAIRERLRAAARRSGRSALRDFRRRAYGFDNIIGEDEQLKSALDQAAKIIARGKATVLISGETGTGKDVLARAIHYGGPRKDAPFVPINCSAIPSNLIESELFGHEQGAFTGAGSAKPGLFEAADGGSLFLDEVATLELELQAKLLRALETQSVRRVGGVRTISVDFRVIAASNDDLPKLVQKGRFREDLYYRLAVIPIHLPPLRERGGDILLIARRFLSDLARSYDLPEPVLTRDTELALTDHRWPGNVRELRNVIERGLLMSEGDAVRPEHLGLTRSAETTAAGLTSSAETAAADPATFAASPVPFPSSLRNMEEAAARAMVELCKGNKSDAARRLGIPRSRLYGLLNRSGAERQEPKAMV